MWCETLGDLLSVLVIFP